MACTVINDPMIAAPNAPPIWRAVAAAPLATPERAIDTSERMTLVNCALARPSPMPNSARPGRICQNVMPGATAQITRSSDPPSMNRPQLMIDPRLNRRVRRALSCAPMMMKIPIGSNHRPLVCAERCTASWRNSGNDKSRPSWPIVRISIVSNP